MAPKKGKKNFGKPANKGQKPQHKAPAKRSAAPTPKGSANLYGVHAVTEAWLNKSRFINDLYITEEALKSFEPVMARAHKAGLKRPDPQITDKRALDGLLPGGAVHQGIALKAQDLAEPSLEALIHANEESGGCFAILDQVTDPHNVGAILRSASAFGMAGVIMQRKHAPELTGVLAKTACGAVEHIPVAYETNLSRAIETLQEHGYFVYGLDERGEKTLAQHKPGKKSVIVLGAEGPGLRRLVAEKCDALVKLPTQGAIASLNVSNAAAVAFYELL